MILNMKGFIGGKCVRIERLEFLLSESVKKNSLIE